MNQILAVLKEALLKTDGRITRKQYVLYWGINLLLMGLVAAVFYSLNDVLFSKTYASSRGFGFAVFLIVYIIISNNFLSCRRVADIKGLENWNVGHFMGSLFLSLTPLSFFFLVYLVTKDGPPQQNHADKYAMGQGQSPHGPNLSLILTLALSTTMAVLAWNYMYKDKKKEIALLASYIKAPRVGDLYTFSSIRFFRDSEYNKDYNTALAKVYSVKNNQIYFAFSEDTFHAPSYAFSHVKKMSFKARATYFNHDKRRIKISDLIKFYKTKTLLRIYRPKLAIGITSVGPRKQK